MRVTGGRLSGRILKVPKGPLDIRPAMDRMRESVFAVLGDLSGTSFLDLFAGSGILGMEAASRGASRVVCVEKDRAKFPVLLENAALGGEVVECRCVPAERFILRAKERFDVVFLDPPFPYAWKRELLESVAKAGLAKDGGLVLMHFPEEDPLPDELGPLARVDERRYGRSVVRFWRMSDEGSDPRGRKRDDPA